MVGVNLHIPVRVPFLLARLRHPINRPTVGLGVGNPLIKMGHCVQTSSWKIITDVGDVKAIRGKTVSFAKLTKSISGIRHVMAVGTPLPGLRGGDRVSVVIAERSATTLELNAVCSGSLEVAASSIRKADAARLMRSDMVCFAKFTQSVTGKFCVMATAAPLFGLPRSDGESRITTKRSVTKGVVLPPSNKESAASDVPEVEAVFRSMTTVVAN